MKKRLRKLHKHVFRFDRKEAPERAGEITKAMVEAGKRFSARASAAELKTWAEQYLD